MSSTYIEIPYIGGGGGAVNSVFGRAGTVIAVVGDYDGSQITNTPAGGITATDIQGAINQLDSNKEPTITVLPVSKGGTGSSSFVIGSIPFSDGSIVTEDNTNFSWDSANKELLIGDQTTLTGDIQGAIRAINTVVGPTPAAVNCAVVTQIDATYADDAPGGAIGLEVFSKLKVALDKTVGAWGGIFAPISRIDAADEGTVSFSAGVVTSITHGNAAKFTGSYSAFLSAFHSIDSHADQIGAMYDFHAMSSSIAPGAVTNRYGIMIEPDSGYTKQNWLSGKVQLGGTSFSTPMTDVKIDGNIYGEKIVADNVCIASEFHATTSTSADGSNNTTGIQLSSTATVDSGFTNDKGVAGMVATVMRGNGSDEGTMDAINGVTSLMFHNPGPAGITNQGFGYAAIVITEGGTLTDLFDFYSERAPAGGAVTNHYGVYIKSDGATPVKNWLSGSTLIGGSSFSAPNAPLDINGDSIIIQSPKTPATSADTGTQGTICWDTDYIYVCTATDTWKRTAIGSW